jgi:hypothetical protein
VQAMRFFVKRVPGEDVGTAALGCPVEQGSTRVWGKACSGRIRLPHCAITSTKQINKHKPRNGNCRILKLASSDECSTHVSQCHQTPTRMTRSRTGS